MAAVHETMEALHKVGAIDKQTMRRFDDACLTPVQPLSAKQIKALRVREHVSQTEPDGVRELPQRDAKSGEQVGARREAAIRSCAQAPVPRRKARHRGRRVITLFTIQHESRIKPGTLRTCGGNRTYRGAFPTCTSKICRTDVAISAALPSPQNRTNRS
jgi:hypothetical protein